MPIQLPCCTAGSQSSESPLHLLLPRGQLYAMYSLRTPNPQLLLPGPHLFPALDTLLPHPHMCSFPWKSQRQSKAQWTRDCYSMPRSKTVFLPRNPFIPIKKPEREPGLGIVTNIPALNKVETEESGIQGHSQVHCESEASLGYLKPCLKKYN